MGRGGNKFKKCTQAVWAGGGEGLKWVERPPRTPFPFRGRGSALPIVLHKVCRGWGSALNSMSSFSCRKMNEYLLTKSRVGRVFFKLDIVYLLQKGAAGMGCLHIIKTCLISNAVYNKAVFQSAQLFCLASLGKPEGRTLFAKGFSTMTPLLKLSPPQPLP